jgi:UDP-N-acetylmuramoyl-tripeptide--D-alanyl-D-alanine ligase
MILTAQQIAQILGTTVAAGDASAQATAGVSTDTRNLPNSCIFIALRGASFDANTFAPQALEQGAAIAIVENWTGSAPAATAVIIVPDTLLALQNLAAWWRTQLDETFIIGLTGSNGKTSTKDLTRAALAEAYPTYATIGNLNNHIGLPLTVLQTTAAHRAAVYEMGMNHPGEIAPLAAIARPHCAIITNIGTSHIEHMGRRENIAREKACVASTLTEAQCLFVPHDCDFLDIIRTLTPARIITTGGASDDIRAEDICETADGMTFTLDIHGEKIPASLSVAGRHMVANALLAAAAAHLAGVPAHAIARGLAHATLTSGRLRRYICRDVTVIDDTYNANPESMIAGLETLAHMPLPDGAKRFAVLGRMGEQGDFLADGCKRVGQAATRLGIHTITIGADTLPIHQAAPGSQYFPDQATAAAALLTQFHAHDAVLFKGSRSARMEQLMHSLFPE